LWLTKELCKKLGGDVRAFSKKNFGSTFVVMLPIESVPELGRVKKS
jgi:signal transduction histidine kinase